MFIFIQSFTLLLEELRNKLHLKIEEKEEKEKKGGKINDFKRGIRKFIEIRKILSMVDDCKCAWNLKIIFTNRDKVTEATGLEKEGIYVFTY